MKVKAKKKNKNPYPKYSYNTGLRREYSNEPIWGIDSKWLIWEIKHGNGLPRIKNKLLRDRV